MTERPSDGYRTAISDPEDFVGRETLLERVRRNPRMFRVLLGGRRIGKTSLLRAIEWRLLQPDLSQPRRAFPVYIDLQRAEPRSLANFRFLLIMRLRQAIVRWQDSMQSGLIGALPSYRTFLSRVAEVKVGFDFLAKIEVKLTPQIAGPGDELSDDGFVTALVRTFEELRTWNFEGVCFLLDEAEYIIRNGWAGDAWPYLRALKDSEGALRSLLGIILSGYRDLKEYRQQVGSPLNIAQIEWLAPLITSESEELAQRRSAREHVAVEAGDHQHLHEWCGAHPFLTQQLLNVLFDRRAVTRTTAIVQVVGQLGRDLRSHFADWWNRDGRSDGFGEDERQVFRALAAHRQGTSITLARVAGLPEGRVLDALEVLIGTGVANWMDDDRATVGSRLFVQWVEQNDPLYPSRLTGYDAGRS